MNFELLNKKAKDAGIDAIQINESTKSKLKVSCYDGELETYTSSSIKGITIKGLINDKLGVTYTEIDNDDIIDEIIHQIKENASIITSNEKELFFDKKVEYKKLDTYHEALNDISTNEIFEILKYLEKGLLAYDKRINAVTSCEFELHDSETLIQNSYGVKAHQKENIGFFVLGCTANENNDTQSEFKVEVVRSLNDIDKDKLIKEVGTNVLGRLNASKVPSNKYKTIIKNKAMANFLNAMVESLSAENVQKGRSIFKDKLNTLVFDPRISIIEDPFLKDGLGSSSFDNEGVPCTYKKVVENGILKQLFYNLKAANKEGIESSGNSINGINPTNLFIENGDKDYDELIKSLDSCVVIKEVSGLHSGLNTLTLDFSLIATGEYVENGKVVKPLNLITVAGNIHAMLNDIDTIANDFKFGDGDNYGSPSILFNSLQITGE